MKDITKMTNEEILNYLKSERKLIFQSSNKSEELELMNQRKQFLNDWEDLTDLAYDHFR